MSAAVTPSSLISSASGPRPIARRIGLVLAAVLGVLAAIPAVTDIGFNGSGMDVVVILLAIAMPAIALATIVFGILAWNGRRVPSTVVIVVQLVGLLQVVPPIFLIAMGVIPAFVAITFVVTIAVTVVAVVLIARGMRPKA